jgi:hypothetical protein
MYEKEGTAKGKNQLDDEERNNPNRPVVRSER